MLDRSLTQKQLRIIKKILKDNLPESIENVQLTNADWDARKITDMECVQLLEDLLKLYKSRISTPFTRSRSIRPRVTVSHKKAAPKSRRNTAGMENLLPAQTTTTMTKPLRERRDPLTQPTSTSIPSPLLDATEERQISPSMEALYPESRPPSPTTSSLPSDRMDEIEEGRLPSPSTLSLGIDGLNGIQEGRISPSIDPQNKQNIPSRPAQLSALLDGMETEVIAVANILKNVLKSQKSNTFLLPRNDIRTITTYLQTDHVIGTLDDVSTAVINCQHVAVESEMSKGIAEILDSISKITFILWYEGIKS